jgi:hypothetical protein
VSRFKSWDEEVAELREKKAREDAEAAARQQEELVAFETAPVRPRPKRKSWGLIWLACVIGLAGMCALGVALFQRFRDAGSNRGSAPSEVRSPGPHHDLAAEFGPRIEEPAAAATAAIVRVSSHGASPPMWVMETLAARFKVDDICLREGMTPGQKQSIREGQDTFAFVAMRLPTDDGALKLLLQSLKYFDSADILEIWMRCEVTANELKDGTSARDILTGVVVTFDMLKIEPGRNKSLAKFTKRYLEWRADSGLGHQPALYMMLNAKDIGEN